MEWTYPGLPQKKFRSVPSAKKVLVTSFWNMMEPILEHYQGKGQTVNRITYSVILKDKFKPAIHNTIEDCYQKLFYSTMTIFASMS
jgi:hypothetical protein